MTIKGKGVIITGASSVVGEAPAKLLAKKGAIQYYKYHILAIIKKRGRWNCLSTAFSLRALQVCIRYM
ncbi:hypothetical protein MX630_09960 [Carnobacterium divergens]|nr:hypothetical protein [Carnobacterium divergens]MDT1942911.1 hypothetical protein [Carnobacterium divergens]MDT1948717.1 hypothetical protein [Carnobacterium divergens]MDT1951198.1 hypothetical protein [Carnobacterium divergens]MDT1956256.1 hypothetical protein [Carnobacterium divergens]